MSDQQPAAVPGTHDPQAAADGSAGADPYKLHDDAMKASALLENIATGLAHANAPEKVTSQFTQMAEICRKIAGAMSRAPAPAPKAAPARETMDTATSSLATSARR